MLVCDVDNGVGYARVGVVLYGRSLYFPLNFVVNCPKIVIYKQTNK